MKDPIEDYDLVCSIADRYAASINELGDVPILLCVSDLNSYAVAIEVQQQLNESYMFKRLSIEEVFDLDKSYLVSNDFEMSEDTKVVIIEPSRPTNIFVEGILSELSIFFDITSVDMLCTEGGDEIHSNKIKQIVT